MKVVAGLIEVLLALPVILSMVGSILLFYYWGLPNDPMALCTRGGYGVKEG
ncbi:MAG: hypothetical protein ACHQFX_17765 [Chitinophagales bacterium]